MRFASMVAVTALSIASTASAQVRDPIRLSAVDPLPRFEQAPSNVRLVFQLIEADGGPTDATSDRPRTTGQVDPTIEPVVTELRKIFRFQAYVLVSTSVLNVIPPTEHMSSSGRQHLTDDRGRSYDLQVGLESVDHWVRLRVDLGTSVPTTRPNGDVIPGGIDLISASVNLQPGKSVVLGSTRLDGTPGALILVVNATYDP